MIVRGIFTGTLLILVSVLASADTPGLTQAEFGQIIVKFANKEPINAEVAMALEKGAETSYEIQQFVKFLAQELRVPLRAGSITSGHELLIEIPYAEVLGRLHEHIHRLVEVTRVVVKKNESGSSFYSTNEVIVSFDSKGEAYTIVNRAAESNTMTDASLDMLATSLAPSPLYALSTRVTADKRLALIPNMNAMTHAITQVLKEREDVEYAQPDYRLHTY